MSKHVEKLGELTACPTCGAAVIVTDGRGTSRYELVAFTRERLEQAIRGAWELGVKHDRTRSVGARAANVLDEYVKSWTSSPVRQAEERARG